MFAKAKVYYKEHFIKEILSFSGRINRKEMICRSMLIEFSLMMLFLVIASLTIAVFFISDKGNSLRLSSAEVFPGIILLIMLIYWSMIVRRLHDLGYSGWQLLPFGILCGCLIALVFFGLNVIFINIVITLAGIYLAAMPGENEENRFGKAPAPIENDWWDKKENRNIQAVFNYLGSMDWINDYLNFNGRLSCRDYFFSTTAVFYFFGILIVIIDLIGTFLLDEPEFTATAIIVLLITALVLLFAVDVRRNHDFDRSFIWSFLVLIPFVNIWYLLRQFCFTGDLEENKYGVPRTWIDENGVLRNNDY